MGSEENVCPQAWGGRAGVARELRRLAARPPPGVKLLLREDDLSDVCVLLEGPGDTPYAGGVFRVGVRLGSEYPAAAPRATFRTRVWHPNVAWPGGDVCLSTLARDWRPELGLAHALTALRCLLIAPNPESALNAEAAEQLRDRYDDYFARAKLYTDIHARAAPPQEPSEAAGGAVTGVAIDGVEGAAASDAVRGEPSGAASEGPAAKRERRPALAPRDKRRILRRL